MVLRVNRAKAIVHELKLKFDISDYTHYKTVKGKNKLVQGTKLNLKDTKDVFEKTYNNSVKICNSVIGFINRELKQSIENLDFLYNYDNYYHDLLIEWIAFLKSKEAEQTSQKKILGEKSSSTLTLREIALLYFFMGKPITIGNQDIIANKYSQKNIGKKLYSNHYYYLKEDDKNIYIHKFSKKYLENIRTYFKDQETINKIDNYIKKCK